MINNEYTKTFKKESLNLSKPDLENVTVIGQIDKKFIAVKTRKNQLLLFDQHAAHERVRLETLLLSKYLLIFESF